MAFDINLLGLFVGIIGTIIGIAGLLIAYETKREQRRIAKESGAFSKPELIVTVFGWPLGVGYPDNEEWCFIHPGQTDELGVFPIEFVVINRGDATCENADLMIQVPQSCLPISLAESYKGIVQPGIARDLIKFSIDEVGHYTQLSLILPPIKPKTQFHLTLQFFFRAVQFPDASTVSPEGIAHFKSNEPFELPFLMMKTHIFAIWLRQIDSAPIFFHMKIRALSARDMDDSMSKYFTARSKFRALYSKMKVSTQSSRESVIQSFWKYFTTVYEMSIYNLMAFDFYSKERLLDTQEEVCIMNLPQNYRRAAVWLGWPWYDNSATILSICESGRSVPKSERRFREQKGNVLTMK